VLKCSSCMPCLGRSGAGVGRKRRLPGLCSPGLLVSAYSFIVLLACVCVQLGLAADKQNVPLPKVVEAFLGMKLAGRSLYRAPLVAGSRCSMAIDNHGQVHSPLILK
jgi:hypothetical protein